MSRLCSHRKYIAMTMSAPTPTPVPLPDPRKVANKQRRKAGREVLPCTPLHQFPSDPDICRAAPRGAQDPDKGRCTPAVLETRRTSWTARAAAQRRHACFRRAKSRQHPCDRLAHPRRLGHGRGGGGGGGRRGRNRGRRPSDTFDFRRCVARNGAAGEDPSSTPAHHGRRGVRVCRN
ncbi:hypothetical protein EI94DRAFT_1715603 [Lactarius quietus]|nr:hypothetical protein EI94DRAFT_1715603 [Lactarius quietus]